MGEEGGDSGGQTVENGGVQCGVAVAVAGVDVGSQRGEVRYEDVVPGGGSPVQERSTSGLVGGAGGKLEKDGGYDPGEACGSREEIDDRIKRG